MIRYFYLTRNILGLIIVISPLAGFLCIDHSLFLSPGFLCGLIVGVPLALGCYTLLSFRLWTMLYVLLSLYLIHIFWYPLSDTGLRP